MPVSLRIANHVIEDDDIDDSELDTVVNADVGQYICPA